MYEIKSGAVFVADSHFDAILGDDDSDAMKFFTQILKNPPPQLFLMGDIFNIFVPAISSSRKSHQKFIQILNELSLHTQIFYFFGNHDFGIPRALFPRIHLFPRRVQPVRFYIHNEKFYTALLSHGDIFISKFYSFYIQAMNFEPFLRTLNFIDFLTFGALYEKIAKKISQKSIKSLPHFPYFAQNRLKSYKERHLHADIFIEGHFHADFKPFSLQNFPPSSHARHYLALPSFHCAQKVIVYRDGEFFAQKLFRS